MTALLKLDAVTAYYGASQALFGVDLEISEGEVVALMGRNGMGKATTVRTICALLRARQGAITFAGQPTKDLPVHRVARLGIGLVPEGRRCFAPLTVLENLTAAARPGAWTLQAVAGLFPGWRSGATSANTFSGGEQQMLAIAGR